MDKETRVQGVQGNTLSSPTAVFELPLSRVLPSNPYTSLGKFDKDIRVKANRGEL